MMKLFLRRSRRRYDVEHLSTSKGDAVVLVRVGPLQETTNQTAQPQLTAPRRRVCRAIVQSIRAIGHKICPCLHSELAEDNNKAENDVSSISIRQPYLRIPSSAVTTTPMSSTTKMEDKAIQVTPSTCDQKTGVIPSTNDEGTQVIPLTKDKETQVIPLTKDEETQVIPLTKDEETQVIPLTKDEETQVFPTTKDEETQVIPSTKDEETQVFPTTKDEETQVIPSTKDEGAQATPLTNDQQTESTPSASDKQTEVTPSTKDQQTAAMPSTSESEQTDEGRSISSSNNLSLHELFREDIESEKSPLTAMSISTSSYGTSQPVSSSNSILDHPCVLSMETLTFHKLLGEGQFGKVMLASHPAIQQKMAVKFMQKMELIYDDAAFSAFAERDTMLASNNSPFTTNLYGTFQTKTHIFFAMEYQSGGTLQKLIRNSAPLDINMIRFIAAELVCGLQHLHAKEIVHRDIKPDNILIDANGHIKISDFGLAWMGVTEQNRIIDQMGSRLYMAPEVYKNEPYYGAADYFSLGIVLYEMFVGEHPFTMGQELEDLEPEDLETSILTMTPYYPEGMDSCLHELIDRMLNKCQDKRWQLVSDLRHLPFFKNIDWAELEKGKSPSPLTFPINEKQQFKTLRVAQFMTRQELATRLDPEEQEQFSGFSYP